MSDLNLLVIMVPQRLHEEVVDTLMGFEDVSGFSVVEAAGFSREHSHFNAAERVDGARRFSRFEILHSPEQRQVILAEIERLVGREHVRYWVVERVEAGSLGS